MTDEEFYNLLVDAEDGKDLPTDKRKQASEKLDTRICCDGYMCGCRGSTFRAEYEHYFKQRDPAGYQRYVDNGSAI